MTRSASLVRRLLVPALSLFLCISSPSTPRASAASYDGNWQLLNSTGATPAARRDLAAIHDPVRDRMVVLAADGRTWVRDFTGTSWTELPIATLNLGSGFERAVYDAANDRMVVIDALMRVYSLPLAAPTAWVQHTVAGSAPVARMFFAVCYDAPRGRLLLYGGGPYSGVFNDLWALGLGTTMQWTQIQPGGSPPPASWGPIAVYDPTRDQVVVGMGTVGGGYENRLWSVSLGGAPAWNAITTSGAAPSGRTLSLAAYDPGNDAIVVFSGYPVSTQDLWELQLGASPSWAELHPTGIAPAGRWSGSAMYRAAGAEVVLFGGFDGATSSVDVWRLARLPLNGAPMILAFSPLGGQVGDPVTISGLRLESVNQVSFNGTPGTLESVSFHSIQTRVPAAASTGPITVSGPGGSSTSSFDFVVGELPLIASANPDSGLAGETITLHGAHFTGASVVRIGASQPLAFTVLSDAQLTVVLDSSVTSGTVQVTTVIGTGTSAVSVRRVADNPVPRLQAVRDVRGDQGGKVSLSWRASDFDRTGYRLITGYRVWRRGPAPSSSAARGEESPAGWMARPSETHAGALEYWESIATLPAAYLAGYSYSAPTLRDSTEGDPAWMAYFVQALTADAFVFYNSVVDSGYSVDNLAPPTPAPFAVTYAPGGNTLHWRGRALADLRGYQVHRGASSTFVPSAATLVVTTGDTTYADIPGGHYYKLAAIDVHGNLSRFVSASPSQPVATLASFVNASRERDRIALTWYSGGNPGLEANVYRRTADSDWQLLRAILADGDGYLRFEDGEVADEVRYGYRLGIVEPDASETLLGETWVDPVRMQFAIIGAGANPSRDGRVSLSFALPAASSARVQLFDIAGREVESRPLAGAAGSTQRVEFGSGARLRAGVYLVRASSGATTLTRRVVVLD